MTDNYPRHIVAACTLVSRQNGDILLVKTHLRGWEIPGGQVEIGETPLEAAGRETHEEAGIIATITSMGGVYSNLTRGLVIFAFLGEHVSGEPTPSDETPDVGWFKRDAVLEMIEHPSIHDRTRDLLNNTGQIIYKAYKNPYQVVSEQFM